MGFLHNFEDILTTLPEVERPRYALTFNEKLKWTGIILVAYFLLSETALYGLDPRTVDIFANLRAVLAGNFGSIITLGIGPIVTGSIILQILVGGKLVDLDLSDPHDQAIFQGTQKILAIIFTLFEAVVMVAMGALPPVNGDFNMALLLILQLTVGGILIIFMDEVVSKWGFGSGIGLFIVAGVASQVVIGSFNPFPPLEGEVVPAGKIPAFIYSLTHGTGDFSLLVPIAGTIIVFAIVVYFESMRVEIPLTYGRFRGARGRYPLKFIYASNIPVIFASILMANVQLWARLLERINHPILGSFVGNRPVNGLAFYMQRPQPIYTPDFSVLHAFYYTVILIILSALFSKFWVETAGMDSKTVAKQLQEGGMQIPGFRGDIRIIERVLEKYIPPLTIVGGIVVGILAAFADILGALGGGMGVLLTVGIVYQMYEQMAREQLMEVHPMLKGILG
ncbi:MAG: preprotein translocase subunit SecY [Methanobacteriota archaeon]|nr:MAG: preprotein translocase subunit SecY [Euryarchaeota archaeon]